MPKEADLSLAAQEVRRYDRERFVTALFAPAERREDLMSLYAFNLEIAKVCEIVSEPVMGQIRLQWWRDAMESWFAGRKIGHQVADAFGEVVRRRELPRDSLERLIDAREFDLSEEAPESMADLQDYADASSGELSVMAARVLGATNEATLLAARHVGTAWALVGMLRAVPFHASRGKIYLPKDILASANVHTRAILDGKPPEELRKVVMRVAEAAQDHLIRARKLGKDVDRKAHAALLPACVADVRLRQLQKAGYNVFDPDVATLRPVPLRLWWKGLAGGY